MGSGAFIIQPPQGLTRCRENPSSTQKQNVNTRINLCLGVTEMGFKKENIEK